MNAARDGIRFPPIHPHGEMPPTDRRRPMTPTPSGVNVAGLMRTIANVDGEIDNADVLDPAGRIRHGPARREGGA